MNKCGTCGKDCEKIYCNQKCYSKSPKLKELAKNSKLIKNNQGNEYHKGKEHTEETKKRISENTPKKIGIDNLSWKGDDVGYHALHDWVKRRKIKSDCCEICSRTNCRIEVANISGEYKRDITDFVWLCCKCHTKFDNLKKTKPYHVIGVEAKSNGYLDQIETEKCEWLLENNIFSKILIASKGKKRGEIIYKEVK